MATLETITTDVRDGVATLTLNRPARRNALSIRLRHEITDTLAAWGSDRGVRAVILTGAGTAFCAGFDLDEFARAELAREIRDSSRRYHLAVWHFGKPLIAAINGPAFGGGFDLWTLCDIRIASRTAVFAHPEIKFGAPPLYTQLVWIVGMGMARELCLTGRKIDAAEAQAVGLVSRVVEPDQLAAEALACARTILEAPQATLERTKSYMVGNAGATFEQAFAIEHDQVFDDFLAGAVGPRA